MDEIDDWLDRNMACPLCHLDINKALTGYEYVLRRCVRVVREPLALYNSTYARGSKVHHPVPQQPQLLGVAYAAKRTPFYFVVFLFIFFPFSKVPSGFIYDRS